MAKPMSDPTILYSGIFCFAMLLLGVALTVREFYLMSAARERADPRSKAGQKT